MARTQIGSDLIQDKTITSEDLHDAENIEASKSPKIYKLTGYKSNFTSIDYTILSLFPKRIANKGEITKVDWYSKNIDGELSDLVLTVDIVYNRDAAGFAISRTTRRRWVNNDDSYNVLEKNTEKFYNINHGEMITEGKKRRGLLVDNIQIPVMMAMMGILIPLGDTEEDVIMKGRVFLDDYDLEFKKFVNNSSTVTSKNDPNYGRKTVVVKIEDEIDPQHTQWLDTSSALLGGATIRQYLVNEFTI